MPELPEVETTRRGIQPHLAGKRLTDVQVREPRLRWPVSRAVSKPCGTQVQSISRRAKYLLFNFPEGALILHLGMSGSLRLLDTDVTPGRHDHVDLVFEDAPILRFTDPRRFGSLHWAGGNALDHELLRHLGPEPLADEFTGQLLYRRSRSRTAPVKNFLMDQRTVVGVGNIYASESLFLAGIHPRRPAGRISLARYSRLADCIRTVLDQAIEAGGTTLRDFRGGDGRPGYFSQQLLVYDREGEDCPHCGSAIRREVIGQRASYYCARCQT